MKENHNISPKMATALQQAKEMSRKSEVSFTVGYRLHVQKKLKGQSSRMISKCHSLTGTHSSPPPASIRPPRWNFPPHITETFSADFP